jgi:ElaB/YqjD/DUF883 family membrane-anchored ribosome-binding protein
MQLTLLLSIASSRLRHGVLHHEFEPSYRENVKVKNQPDEDEMDNATKASGKSEAQAERLKQKAGEVVDAAQEKLEEAYDDISTRAVEAGDAMRDYANEATNMLDQSLKVRPLSTLAGAVAVGFLLGAIWRL